MRVRTVTGDLLEHHVQHATGSEVAPMTDEQLRPKAQLVARPILGEERVDERIDLAFGIDRLEDLKKRSTTPGEH